MDEKEKERRIKELSEDVKFGGSFFKIKYVIGALLIIGIWVLVEYLKSVYARLH